MPNNFEIHKINVGIMAQTNLDGCTHTHIHLTKIVTAMARFTASGQKMIVHLFHTVLFLKNLVCQINTVILALLITICLHLKRNLHEKLNMRTSPLKSIISKHAISCERKSVRLGKILSEI